MTDSTRTYRSPLREAQAGQTRGLILDAFAGLVADGRVDGWSVRQLATAAGVSERTVYRYFPDRGALVEGLTDYLIERIGAAPIEASLETTDDLVAVVEEMFRLFDAEADLTRAALILRIGPGPATDDSQRRNEMMAGLIERSFPALADVDRQRLLAVVRSLTGSATWLRMREEFGLSGDESGAIVSWALGVLFTEIRARGGIVMPSAS